MKEIIIIENKKIEKHLIVSDQRELKDNEYVVHEWNGIVGESVDYYDENWNRKNQIQLISDGLEKLPIGFKIENDKLVEMTRIEKINAEIEKLANNEKIVNNEIIKKTEIEMYKDGSLKIPMGFKIDDDKLVEMTIVEKINAGFEQLPIGYKIAKNEIVEKTLNEKLSDGDITESEYNLIQIEELKSELNSLDLKAIRPLRAILANEATAEDKTTLSKIETQVKKLRTKINELGGTDD